MSLEPKGSKLMQRIKAFQGPQSLGLPEGFSLLSFAELKG